MTPPPLATPTASAVEPVTSGLITGAPAAQVPTQTSTPAAVAPPTSPVAAPTQYTGGTNSTVVQEPNARIPSTPSGVASETTTGTPSGATQPAELDDAKWRTRHDRATRLDGAIGNARRAGAGRDRSAAPIRAVSRHEGT